MCKGRFTEPLDKGGGKTKGSKQGRKSRRYALGLPEIQSSLSIEDALEGLTGRLPPFPSFDGGGVVEWRSATYLTPC